MATDFGSGQARAGGTMQARGTAHTPGEIKACSITHKVDGWFLSLVVACEPHHEIDEDAAEISEMDTKSVKPSQRCPTSWRVRKMKLSERTHTLPCGRIIDRDHAAALVMVRAALRSLGREPTWIP